MLKKAVLKLEVGNVWTRAYAGPNLLSLISENLAFEVPGCQFSEKYRKKLWDGKKRFFRLSASLFQTGLVPYVLNGLPLDKIDVRIIDKRVLPFDLSKYKGRTKWPRVTEEQWQRELDYIQLKSDPRKIKYQVQAINDSMHHSFRGEHWPRGVIAAATGAGKTLLVAGLIKTLNLPTLFTVHRLDLMNQTRRVFEQVMPPGDIGQIGGGKYQLDKKITISSIQTLSKRRKNADLKKFLARIPVWIVDESHMVGDNAYYAISNLLTRAYYRYGLTGTAFKKSQINDMFARSMFGEEVFSLRSKKLIDDGLLARPVINMVDGDFAAGQAKLGSFTSQMDAIREDTTEYELLYRTQITHNEARNMWVSQIAQEAVARGEKVLILVSRIPHGEVLESLLAPFLSTEFVSGRDKTGVRDDAVERFQSGVTKILIVSTIFDMGRDIPCINTIVLAGAGSDTTTQIQRVGRALRLSDGKTRAMVYDFNDRVYPFSEQVKKRLAAFDGEGWDIVFREAS